MNLTVTIICLTIVICVDLITTAFIEIDKNRDKSFWENYDKFIKYNGLEAQEEDEE